MQLGAVGQVQNHMGMAGRILGSGLPKQFAGHAQMDDQAPVLAEIQQQVFAPAAQLLNFQARQKAGKHAGVRQQDAGIKRVYAGDGCAGEMRGEAAPNRFEMCIRDRMWYN